MSWFSCFQLPRTCPVLMSVSSFTCLFLIAHCCSLNMQTFKWSKWASYLEMKQPPNVCAASNSWTRAFLRHPSGCPRIPMDGDGCKVGLVRPRSYRRNYSCSCPAMLMAAKWGLCGLEATNANILMAARWGLASLGMTRYPYHCPNTPPSNLMAARWACPASKWPGIPTTTHVFYSCPASPIAWGGARQASQLIFDMFGVDASVMNCSFIWINELT